MVKGPFGASFSPARTSAWVAVGLLTAFVLFYRIGVPSWNFDEYFFGIVGRRFLEGYFDQDVGVHPYLGTYLIGVIPALGSTGTTGVRLAPAIAGFATAGVLFFFARRVAGYWAGLLAFALWGLLPHESVMDGVAFAAIKIERFGLLDVFMELFIAAALYAGWRWTGSEDWRWALSTGLLAGMATASKLAGAVVLVPILALSLITPGLDRRVAQTAVVVVLCPGVLLLSFLPVLPEAPDRLGEMFDLARVHQELGHTVVVAGDLYTGQAPWWANAWFMWDGMGPFATLSLLIAAAAAVALIDRRLSIYLGLAVAAPFVSLATIYDIALPHYYFLWLAPLTLLAALGLHQLAASGGFRAGLAGVLVLAMGVAAVTTMVNVASQRTGDYRRAAEQLERAGLGEGKIVVAGLEPILGDYLRKARLLERPTDGVDAVVIDRGQVRRTGDPRKVQRWVRLHQDRYRRMDIDHLSVFVRKDAPRRSGQ